MLGMADFVSFATPQDWADWLAVNHATETEVLVQMFKLASGLPSITWEQAVVEALVWGWIDGIARTVDDISWVQRFTPRRAKSGWSQRNRGHVERLIAEGRMQAPGLAAVAAAKADGRWEAAYSGKDFVVPPDFLAALAQASAAAQAHFAGLTRQNQFAVYYRLTTAKRAETRVKRVAEFVAMMERGEKFH